MTIDEKKRICDDIYRFITVELDQWMDDQIFVKTSMKELGELYYNHILNEVENADIHLLNTVIKVVGADDAEYKTQEEYYIALCEILHLKNLPSAVWTAVERKYNEIFVQRYSAVMKKYRSEIEKINADLIQTKQGANKIKSAKSKNSFLRDISTNEQEIYELSSKCNYLRTRKEMLVFAMDYVMSRLLDFCDVYAPECVENAKKRETLKLSKEKNYNVQRVFLPYQDHLEILEDDIDRPYVLFFKVKIYVIIENAKKQYQTDCYMKSNAEAIAEYERYIQQIPKIDDLQEYKTNNPVSYNEALDKLILDYEMLKELQGKLESSVCLRERKAVLLKAVELYEKGEYEVFNNILPIQIEGMFADYLQDTTTFSRFSKMNIYENDVLKDKIKHLQEVNSDIYPEAVEYFMYYFNNMIRNKIAHGRYKGNPVNPIQEEIFAKELILDMCLLVHMLSRNSETEKMHRFIHSYQEYYKRVIHSTEEHQRFGALFSDMIGKKIIVDYDAIDSYRPIQVAYWLVNPYYEKIYEQVDDKNDLLELRKEFLSEEFWQYVLKKLNGIIAQGYDHLDINMEFLSVVKGLFSCNISREVKQILKEVNKALLKIKDMQ